MNSYEIGRGGVGNNTILACIVIALALVSSTPVGNIKNNTEVLAIVNGVEIKEERLNKYIENYKQGIVQGLVMDELLYQKAEELGVEVLDSEVDEKIEEIKGSLSDGETLDEVLKEQGLSEEGLRNNIKNIALRDKLIEKAKEQVDIPEESIKSAYEADRENYINMDVYYAIFKGEEKARQFKKELALTDSFEDLEEKYKNDIEVKEKLSNVTRLDGVIGAEIDNVKKGDTLIVKREEIEGFLVVKVIEKRETFEEVRDYIKGVLAESLKYDEFQLMMDEFLERAKIDYK